MIVLGIESSCDETAAALVNEKREILAETVLSQEEHKIYGGVVPEIAARSHLDHIDDVIEHTFHKAGIRPEEVDAIAATSGPGLIGGVVVGVMAAKALAFALGKPFVAVNHLEGHALVSRLTNEVEYPYLLLLVSGGHCQILAVKGVGDYERLGTTIDDAAGEAFDKAVARFTNEWVPGSETRWRVADDLIKAGVADDQAWYLAKKYVTGSTMDDRIAGLLSEAGLPDAATRARQFPHEFSGGMRQRALIAIGLACRPDLLIADEPTTALDVTIQAQILELMNDLRHKLGMSIIMITHDLGVVAQMCEKIAVMYAGHIVEYGTTDEIFYNPQHEYTKGLINSIPKLNAEEKERLVPIEGQPVDLLNPPAGCPFAPRCKSCMKVCLNKMPPRTELSDTHYTYCWLRQKEEFEKGGKA